MPQILKWATAHFICWCPLKTRNVFSTAPGTSGTQFRLAVWTKNHGEEEANSMTVPCLSSYVLPPWGQIGTVGIQEQQWDQHSCWAVTVCEAQFSWRGTQPWAGLVWSLDVTCKRLVGNTKAAPGSFPQRLGNKLSVHSHLRSACCASHWRKSPGQPDLCCKVANDQRDCFVGGRLTSPRSFTTVHTVHKGKDSRERRMLACNGQGCSFWGQMPSLPQTQTTKAWAPVVVTESQLKPIWRSGPHLSCKERPRLGTVG